ncbi:two component transcriptional regulator, LytTR family [Lachnospiraceae bacterium C10]|jgi:DNA-binding LytR/AlgR family response regulator|nr:two component transcriptional regulator, LytTR family [Lachnospiraceae bacterium C10]SDW68735.1 DNA-binding response regulator, LytR/AlgR family [Lachnospiraceae bacterium KHCPX20]
MIKIAICEDENNLATILEQCIYHTLSGYEDMKLELDVFNSPEDFKEHADAYYDLYFLDVEFSNSKRTGLDIAEMITGDPSHSDGLIIFVSSYPDYSIESIPYRPFRYMVKPATQEKIDALFVEIFREYDAKRQFVTFNRGKSRIYINCHNILYITNEDNRRLRIKYVDGTADDIFYCKSKEAEAKLSPLSFIRINKGMIINLHYVESFRDNVVTMKGGDTDTVSRSQRKNFEEALHQFLFARMRRG